MQLKDVIHHYLGCEVIVDFTRYIISNATGLTCDKTAVLCKFDSINRNKDIDQCWGVTVKHPNGFEYYDNTFNQKCKFYTMNVHSTVIKPLLRDLKDITAEDINELWMAMGFSEDFENPAYGFKKVDYIKDYISGNGAPWDFDRIAPFTAWLLSKHFDLFNLISSSQAITKTP